MDMTVTPQKIVKQNKLQITLLKDTHRETHLQIKQKAYEKYECANLSNCYIKSTRDSYAQIKIFKKIKKSAAKVRSL